MTEFTFDDGDDGDGDFDLSATAECDECGRYLSSSDEDCDHGGQPVEQHVFRKIGEGRESIVGVECVIRQKWDALEERVGDEWIEYEWIGTRSHVNALISDYWTSVEELPTQEHPTKASKD